ncbi:uncharacterized protein LOC142560956 [Dermacentor variabilis]|uniref:uncharacterized protein LOC142560956 n=1 Tax=Dermacentor variabilis TaxID=34621 RepID=UPI003F5B7CB0
MPSLRGVIVGDSQVKFLNRSRLRLIESIKTCTFSFAGYNAVRLARAVSTMRFERVDFAVLYVGGNDLESNVDPQEICDNIKALVVRLQRDVAPVVLVFKVLPRCLEGADAEQKMKKRRLLNRKLTATLKRMPCLRILNPEHRFLNASKKPRRPMFADDGYHVHRGRGIDQLAKIVVNGLAQQFGHCVKSPARAEPGALYKAVKCCFCNTKGHKSYECMKFCRPAYRHMSTQH